MVKEGGQNKLQALGNANEKDRAIVIKAATAVASNYLNYRGEIDYFTRNMIYLHKKGSHYTCIESKNQR